MIRGKLPSLDKSIKKTIHLPVNWLNMIIGKPAVFFSWINIWLNMLGAPSARSLRTLGTCY